NDFSSAEISHILHLAESINMQSSGLMSIIEAIDKQSSKLPSMTNFDFNRFRTSIFSDYLLIGANSESNIRLRNGNKQEAIIFVIEQNVFIGTNKGCNILIDNETLQEHRLYYFNPDAKVKINKLILSHSNILRIYENQLLDEVIKFKNKDYDFKFYVDKNHFQLFINNAKIQINGKKAAQKNKIPLFYDDVIQIQEYSPFSLLTIIQKREKIGIQKIKPEEFYINFQDNFLNISLKNTNSTITKAILDDVSYYIHPPKRGWSLFINNKRIDKPTVFKINSDILTLNKINFRINIHFDIVEIPFEIEQIQLIDLKHFFKDGTLGLDRISLTVKKGNLVAIMGKSGCGKSTLLKTFTAEVIPTYGHIDIDGNNYYKKIGYFSQYIGYVPQQDLLFPSLTVYENLLYRGQLKMPKFSKSHLDTKINNVLSQLNLMHKKDNVIGDENTNILSGGERKRVNLALELLFEPILLIVDEPTSGLSSSDSEQIIEILREITHQGKIVIATIHQPSPTIFEKFDKLLLMDMQGKEVYFGDLDDSFRYFDNELEQIEVNKDKLKKKQENRLPEYFFDIINYPEYSDEENIIYEYSDENVSPKRKFSPMFWKEKFKRISLFYMISFKKNKRDSVAKPKKRKNKKLKLSSYIKQFKTFSVRNFK
ncbi:MAG: ATP-binding cassette domain-containing protein, partial [Candidatus Cloacimonadota bacterium]|nr:ATP-binding cassette domain-containing protein [Candidatus Cloacimonadota bacterium]